MKIATILRKDYSGYRVSVRDENHSVVGEHLFTTRMDAENAMALIEAATKRLGGETDVFDNKQVALLARAVNDRLHGVR